MFSTNEIQRPYAEYGSISRVSRELGIFCNIVRKHLNHIQEVRDGLQIELLPEKQTRNNRVVTEQCICFVHKNWRRIIANQKNLM